MYLCLFLLLGCGDGPGAPSTGRLFVAVSGLPARTEAAVNITGPDGFVRVVTRSQTLAALTPGVYTIAASVVDVDDAGYAPTPSEQTISVLAGDEATAVAVAYVLAIGRLTLTIAGLPAGAMPDVEVVGPDFQQRLTVSSTLTSLAPGSYTITASSVTVGATLYNPSLASQTVTISPAFEPVTAQVSYDVSAAGMFNLAVDGMYVVQSVQRYDGTIPLIDRRDGLLRVFVLANQANAVQPSVRVHLYQNGTPLGTSVIPAPRASVPMTVEEDDLASSWNLVIPAEQLRPGLSVAIEIDPEGVIEEGNEADNLFPLVGTSHALTVQPVPPLQIRFVQIHQSANQLRGNVATANHGDFLATMRRVHPIVDVAADVRPEVYTTSAPPLDATDSEEWSQVLSELNAVRVTEPDAGRRHYYGVVHTPYTSGIAGLAYVGGRSALGWDYLPSGANVLAHEMGHSWGRHHAPCGGVSRPDLQYPYRNGSIGVYGYDFVTGTIRTPASTDLMGYCGSQWISDYTYLGVLSYRDADAELAAVVGLPVPSVLVWGRIVDGVPVLEPMFQVMARPAVSTAPGPYTVEARDAAGTRIFARSFDAEEVADGADGDRHFAFTVPLANSRVAAIASLRASSRYGTMMVRAAAPSRARFRVGAAPGDATLRRGAAGRVALRWNAAAHPMVMVRDPRSGRILAFARGGSTDVAVDGDAVELVASDRLHSQAMRVPIAP